MQRRIALFTLVAAMLTTLTTAGALAVSQSPQVYRVGAKLALNGQAAGLCVYEERHSELGAQFRFTLALSNLDKDKGHRVLINGQMMAMIFSDEFGNAWMSVEQFVPANDTDLLPLVYPGDVITVGNAKGRFQKI